MIIDDEAKASIRKKLNALVASQTEMALRGQYTDLAAFERQRGVIIGLGMAIDILEPETPATPTEKLSTDETDEQNAA